MEQLKHECGVAMIRLLKPQEYYKEKYGTTTYALDKLYLLMEKQHNRGQEGAGMACLKLDAKPGEEYMFRERAVGTVLSLRYLKQFTSIPKVIKPIFIWGISATPLPEKEVWNMCIRF